MEQKKEDRSLDDQIEEMNCHLAEMQKGQEQLFEKMGISAHQYHHFLNDPEKCPPVIKERADALVQRLSEMIDKKTQDKCCSKKRDCCCCHDEELELN